MILPMFLLLMYMFWQLFAAMSVQIRIRHAMDESTAQIAQYAYAAVAFRAEDAPEDGGITVPNAVSTAGLCALAGKQIRQIVGKDAMRASPMHGKYSLAGSRVDLAGDAVLIVSYTMEIRGIPGIRIKIPIRQFSRRKCWTGTQDRRSDEAENEEEETVFVTETGRVYHRSMSCYHLNVSVKRISAGSLSGARNRGGGKYAPCEHCASASALPAVIYITPEGNRYHVVKDCSGLKRTVRTVKRSETSLPPCSSCGKEN